MPDVLRVRVLRARSLRDPGVRKVIEKRVRRRGTGRKDPQPPSTTTIDVAPQAVPPFTAPLAIARGVTRLYSPLPSPGLREAGR